MDLENGYGNVSAGWCVLVLIVLVLIETHIENRLHWTTKLSPSSSDLNTIDYQYSLGRSSAAGISSEDEGHWPSVTSPEQWLGHGQWWYWPVIWMIESHGIIYINYCDVYLLQALLLSWLALKKLPVIDALEYFTYRLLNKEYFFAV